MTSPQIPADLATASRGTPVDFEIRTSQGDRIGHVTCPDANTAQVLATFRFGADVTVRRAGARA